MAELPGTSGKKKPKMIVVGEFLRISQIAMNYFPIRFSSLGGLNSADRVKRIWVWAAFIRYMKFIPMYPHFFSIGKKDLPSCDDIQIGNEWAIAAQLLGDTNSDTKPWMELLRNLVIGSETAFPDALGNLKDRVQHKCVFTLPEKVRNDDWDRYFHDLLLHVTRMSDAFFDETMSIAQEHDSSTTSIQKELPEVELQGSEELDWAEEDMLDKIDDMNSVVRDKAEKMKEYEVELNRLKCDAENLDAQLARIELERKATEERIFHNKISLVHENSIRKTIQGILKRAAELYSSPKYGPMYYLGNPERLAKDIYNKYHTEMEDLAKTGYNDTEAIVHLANNLIYQSVIDCDNCSHSQVIAEQIQLSKQNFLTSIKQELVGTVTSTEILRNIDNKCDRLMAICTSKRIPMGTAATYSSPDPQPGPSKASTPVHKPVVNKRSIGPNRNIIVYSDISDDE